MIERMIGDDKRAITPNGATVRWVRNYYKVITGVTIVIRYRSHNYVSVNSYATAK